MGISNAVAGMITTLPLLAFALLSPFAPLIAHRIGMEWTIAVSLFVLVIGIAIRSLTGIGFLFTGTLFVGLAIAIGNVLMPGMIKLNFPYKIGLMTGLYAVFMNIFGALGSGLSVPFASAAGLGWRGALAIWGLLTVISLVIWFPQLHKHKKRKSVKENVEKASKKSLWRSPLAWSITLFMGGQSLAFYTLIAWMPDILRSIGYNPDSAGWMVFLMQFALIPTTFVIPIIAEKLNNQSGLGIGTAVLFIIGFAGLMQGGATFVPLWAVLLGIGGGSGFSLSMMFFTIRTRDGKEAAELSGMAQSLGYLLAAVGPVLVGVLHDVSNGWTLPLSFLVFISVVILIAGAISGREGYVSEQLQQVNLTNESALSE